MSETSSEQTNSQPILNAMNGLQSPPRLQGRNSEENFRSILDWAWDLFNSVSLVVLTMDARIVQIEKELQALETDISSITDLSATAGGVDDSVVDVGAAFNQTVLNNNFRDIVAKLNAVKNAHDLAFSTKE